MLQNPNGELNLNVNLRDAKTVECGNCNSRLFEQHYVLKRIPKVMIGAPTDVPVPVPIWCCSSCNAVLADFIPTGVGTFDDLFNLTETANDE